MKRAIHAWRTWKQPLVTHDLIDDASDPIRAPPAPPLARQQAPTTWVKMVFHPEFVTATSPTISLDYEQFVRGWSATGVFPSYYEPGYTPMECTAATSSVGHDGRRRPGRTVNSHAEKLKGRAQRGPGSSCSTAATAASTTRPSSSPTTCSASRSSTAASGSSAQPRGAASANCSTGPALARHYAEAQHGLGAASARSGWGSWKSACCGRYARRRSDRGGRKRTRDVAGSRSRGRGIVIDVPSSPPRRDTSCAGPAALFRTRGRPRAPQRFTRRRPTAAVWPRRPWKRRISWRSPAAQVNVRSPRGREPTEINSRPHCARRGFPATPRRYPAPACGRIKAIPHVVPRALLTAERSSLFARVQVIAGRIRRRRV